MLNGVQILTKALLISALVIICSLSHQAQVSSEQLRKILAEKAGFESVEFAALDNGETVVKSLWGKDKKQVAACGIVRLQNGPEISMAIFRESLTQKTNTSRLAGGVFSTPPNFEDLKSLKLQDGDIEDLKRCVVANCDVRMSAAMIKRMQTEVDWSSADSKKQASQLYKQMLVDYVGDYLKGGDQALMQYDSRKLSIRLADDYRKLLDESFFIKEFAPELARYLRDFPRTGLSDVENTLNWSMVTFGLDPIINITHTANYSRQINSRLLLIANKQIYSSRYIDSSLALTLLVTIPTANGEDTYLIFTDISRSNVLDGAFGGVKQRLVENEAKAKIADILNRAKLRLETNATNQIKLTPPTDETGPLPSIRRLGQHWAVRTLLAVLLGLTIALIYREWRRSSAGRK